MECNVTNMLPENLISHLLIHQSRVLFHSSLVSFCSPSDECRFGDGKKFLFYPLLAIAVIFLFFVYSVER